MKIIYLYISTANPSANVSGYFTDRELASKEVERMKKVIEDNPDYYGKWEDCAVREDEIIISNKLEQ